MRTTPPKKKKKGNFGGIVLKKSFKGFWVPSEIYLNKSLSWSEKVFLIEVNELETKYKGCFASNKHFAEYLGLNSKWISDIITKLKKKGLLNIKFKGQTRYLSVDNDAVIKLHEDNMHVLLEQDARPVRTGNAGGSTYNKSINKFSSSLDCGPRVRADKNKSKKSTPKSKYKYDTKHYNLSAKILRHQHEEFPNLVRNPKDKNKIQSGAHVLSQLERIDKLDFDTIIKPVLLWAIEDNFWSINIQSCGPLRNKNKGDDRTKFDKIYTSYLRENEDLTPVKNPFDPRFTEPFLNFLDNTKNTQVKKLYIGLGTIKKWLEGLRPVRLEDNTTWQDFYRGFSTFSNKYLQWLKEQDWIENRSPSLFYADSPVFKKFKKRVEDNIDQTLL